MRSASGCAFAPADAGSSAGILLEFDSSAAQAFSGVVGCVDRVRLLREACATFEDSRAELSEEVVDPM